MTTGIQSYALKKMQDNYFGIAGNTPPATIYAALFTSGSEVANSNNYARVAITNNATNFPPGTSANPSIISMAEVDFAVPSGSWGTPNQVYLYDSGTYGAGNLLAIGTIVTPTLLSSGDTVKFAAGAITLSLGS